MNERIENLRKKYLSYAHIKKIKIESSAGFDFNLELIVKAHKMGYKIGEIPATWRDRTAGKSRFKLLKWLPNI